MRAAPYSQEDLGDAPWPRVVSAAESDLCRRALLASSKRVHDGELASAVPAIAGGPEWRWQLGAIAVCVAFWCAVFAAVIWWFR